MRSEASSCSMLYREDRVLLMVDLKQEAFSLLEKAQVAWNTLCERKQGKKKPVRSDALTLALICKGQTINRK